MNNQKDINKKPTAEPLDFDATLQIIHDTVVQKNSDLKVFIPALLAVVISVFSYLFVQSFTKETLIYVCIIFAYIVVAFLSLLRAYFPCSSYRQPSEKHFMNHMTLPLFPWLLDSYINLTDNVFVKKFENYIGRECTVIEQLKLRSIKQQINEVNHKFKCIKLAYNIVFWGGIVLVVLMIFGIILIMNGLL